MGGCAWSQGFIGQSEALCKREVEKVPRVHERRERFIVVEHVRHKTRASQQPSVPAQVRERQYGKWQPGGWFAFSPGTQRPFLRHHRAFNRLFAISDHAGLEANASSRDKTVCDRLGLPFAEIVHELLNGFVRLWVSAHEREELGRHGHDVRAGLYRLADVDHLPNAADDDLTRRVPLFEGLAYLAHN